MAKSLRSSGRDARRFGNEGKTLKYKMIKLISEHNSFEKSTMNNPCSSLLSPSFLFVLSVSSFPGCLHARRTKRDDQVEHHHSGNGCCQGREEMILAGLGLA
jgi:hypothetical protein